MIGYATIELSYDPNGKYSFPLTAWVNEMKIQSLLGISVRTRPPEFISF